MKTKDGIINIDWSPMQDCCLEISKQIQHDGMKLLTPFVVTQDVQAQNHFFPLTNGLDQYCFFNYDVLYVALSSQS